VFYTPQKTFISPKQISGYAPAYIVYCLTLISCKEWTSANGRQNLQWLIAISFVVVIVGQKSKHGHGARMKRSLKSSPDVITIGMIWDSAEPDASLVTSVMKTVDCSIHISTVSFIKCFWLFDRADVMQNWKYSKMNSMMNSLEYDFFGKNLKLFNVFF